MRKILYIFFTIIIIIGGIIFFEIWEKREIKAAAGPIAAMKTRVDGYFYIPAISPQSLKVVLLFDNPNIEGDQTGTSGEYPIKPDGKVDLFDATLINARYGAKEGDANWEYIADIVPDRKVNLFDAVVINAHYGNTGTYITDLTGVTVEFDTGDVCNLNGTDTCNIPATATEFWLKKNGNPIGAYILFYAAPGATWPHISITAPANVTVNQEFSVNLTYTHDANEVGGIHLRWQDSDFDIPDPAGCTVYDDPAFAPGWEGIECYFVNSGTTTTVTLRALTTGTKTLYYRAWDETQDYDCGGGNFDYNRDPDWSSCTADCDPAGFPDLWEECGAYSQDITVVAVATWPHVSITSPASVNVDEEFLVSLTYTHDAAEVGGIHLRWQDSEFDIPDPAGCTVYDNPAFAPGWEGIECYLVNSGTTTTVTLRALSAGTKTLYYRAWDETRDYDCGTYLDHNRDPSAGTDPTRGSCTPQCHPDEFPDRWEDCDAYSQGITVVAAVCTCNPWVNDACAAAGCAANQMHQTRTCNPPGCDVESQCVNDSCTPWVNDACGAGGCTADKMHQTRTCTYHCLPESQCIVDPACAPPPCTCNAWVNDACGAGGCSANQMHQARTCNPPGCDTESQCIADPACVPPPPTFRIINPLACDTIPECIEKIISFIFWVAMAIVPIIILIAGFLFLTSGGDPEKTRTAKKMILYACIGLAIILLAKGIISVIKTVIGG